MKDKAKKFLILGGSILVAIIIIISAVIIINSKNKQAEEKITNISDYTIHDKLPEENNQDTENSTIIELQEDEEIIDKVSTGNTNDVTIEKEIQVSKDKDIVVEKNKDQIKQEQLSDTTDKKVTETKNENNKSENPSETVTPEKPKEDTSKPIENTNSNKTEPKVEENKNENNSSNNDVNNNSTDENKNEDTNTESNTNTDKKEENNTETKVVETFKYNDTMSKKIKSIIEANESEYMKKYGYNVTIDGTIVNLTNQFTFTEDRVIDSLKYKFNTIRVYARDYYVNGVFMWTECFII